ncbi:hypothetical protein B0H67DRAFT_647464 [Lasiosphaeris hirsuta]|uniref:Uncharacterized protein n=1 Tax=Lasiosphaeris hirsuta TaxID=260670 RepID=A0AA40DNF4_9PEZI|nr:hypothetical protein B0H67DRAFT_647464 [Lasiosphaeris hirsuta]
MQTFKPECTLPPLGTNYVSGPNTRSTLGILWNCLSIIILCTWSIQHLNVPRIRGDPGNFRQRILWSILDLWTKLKWMILTILVPEYLLPLARRLSTSEPVVGLHDEGWLVEHRRGAGV